MILKETELVKWLIKSLPKGTREPKQKRENPLAQMFQYCILASIIALYAKIWEILHSVNNRHIVHNKPQ